MQFLVEESVYLRLLDLYYRGIVNFSVNKEGKSYHLLFTSPEKDKLKNLLEIEGLLVFFSQDTTRNP